MADHFDSWPLAGIQTARGGPHKLNCPKCKGKASLSVNPRIGAFRCWRPACDWHGWVGEKKGDFARTNDTWKPLVDRTDTMQGAAAVINWLNKDRALPLDLILNAQDLGIERDGANMWVAFKYYDGPDLMMCKKRTKDKRMTQYPNPTAILYRLNAVKYTDDVILTEGELDALSFVAAGFGQAASIPNGAADREMKWIENCGEWLEPKGRIYLALDADKPGRDATEEIARRMGKHRCWLVDFPEGCNDANATLVAFGVPALVEAFAKARPYPVLGINHISGVKEMLEHYRQHGFPDGAKTGTKLDQLITWHPGEVTVWTGHANHGKSPFVSNVMAWLSLNHGDRYAVFSPEYKDYAVYSIHLVELIVGKTLPDAAKSSSGMTAAELASATEFLDGKAIELRPEGGEYTVDAICDLARVLVSQNGINHLVIDHWKKLEFPDGKEPRLAARAMLNQLKALAVELSIHVHIVAHPTTKRFLQKSDNGINIPPVLSLAFVSESDDFLNLADNGISIHRTFLEDADESGARIDSHTTTHVIKVKNKWVGKCGELHWHFDVRNNRYRPANTQPDTAYWLAKNGAVPTMEAMRAEINGFFDSTEPVPF